MTKHNPHRSQAISHQPFAFQKGKKRKGRAILVLLGLIEMYLTEGQPIGSNRLKEHLFPEMSSSTIRNYCADLESLGYLRQQHTSGGRIPTDQGILVYAKEILQILESNPSLSPFTLSEKSFIQDFQKYLKSEPKTELNQDSLWGVVPWIERAMQKIVNITDCAIVLSIPRFDQDFITDVRLIQIDTRRLSVIMTTYFGFIRHEVIVLEQTVPNDWNVIESYLRSKMHSSHVKVDLNSKWETLAKRLYEEISIRFLLGKNRFAKGTILYFGLSQLLCRSDFGEISTLASAFNLFEEEVKLQDILTSAQTQSSISLWVGYQLTEVCPKTTGCSLVAIPYKLGQIHVGSVALLGPISLNYRLVFGLLMSFKPAIEQVLLRYVYRYNLDMKSNPIHNNRLGHLPQQSSS